MLSAYKRGVNESIFLARSTSGSKRNRTRGYAISSNDSVKSTDPTEIVATAAFRSRVFQRNRLLVVGEKDPRRKRAEFVFVKQVEEAVKIRIGNSHARHGTAGRLPLRLGKGRENKGGRTEDSTRNVVPSFRNMSAASELNLISKRKSLCISSPGISRSP